MLLIDENLSWKDHIRTLTTKISKTVSLIAKLRHIVPNQTLLNILYLILRMDYFLGKMQLKPCSIKKRGLRLIHFAQAREHAIPLFLKGKLLLLKSLYYGKIIYLIYDVNTNFEFVF